LDAAPATKARVVAFLKQKKAEGTLALGARFTDAREITQALLDQYFKDPDGLKAALPDVFEGLEASGAKKYAHLNKSFSELKKSAETPKPVEVRGLNGPVGELPPVAGNIILILRY